jgi:predicted GIY-YIG superfamily endonuclease
MGARVYILFSQSAGQFYVGSTKLSLEERLKIHLDGLLPGAFTAKAKDWKPFLVIECSTIQQARWIEMNTKNKRAVAPSKTWLNSRKCKKSYWHRLVSSRTLPSSPMASILFTPNLLHLPPQNPLQDS